MRRMTVARLLALALALALAPAAGVYAQPPAGAKVKFIYQERSLYRNILVLEGAGQRCITFGRYHGEQTCIALADTDRMVFPYTKGLMGAFYAQPAPRRVLVIGLGGGVVSRAIRKVFPAATIDSVELDPAVARVAQSHFGFRGDARSHVHVNDGRVFVRQQRRSQVRYDVILVDAFDKDYIPEHMLTKEFLGEMKSLLTPKGVLAANTFATGALERHEAATYQAVFGELYNIDLESGNRIVLAGRDGLPPLAAMQANGRLLDRAFVPLGFGSGYLLPKFATRAPELRVRPLTDQFAPSNLLLRY